MLPFPLLGQHHAVKLLPWPVCKVVELQSVAWGIGSPCGCLDVMCKHLGLAGQEGCQALQVGLCIWMLAVVDLGKGVIMGFT